LLSQHPSNQAVYNKEEDNDKQTEVTHQTTILCPCSVHLFHLCETVAEESSCILKYSTLEIEITNHKNLMALKAIPIRKVVIQNLMLLFGRQKVGLITSYYKMNT